LKNFFNPRFKSILFNKTEKDLSIIKLVKRIKELKTDTTEIQSTEKINIITNNNQEAPSLWKKFEQIKRTSSNSATQQISQDPVTEMLLKYLNEPTVDRCEDPLLWWKNNFHR